MFALLMLRQSTLAYARAQLLVCMICFMHCTERSCISLQAAAAAGSASSAAATPAPTTPAVPTTAPTAVLPPTPAGTPTGPAPAPVVTPTAAPTTPSITENGGWGVSVWLGAISSPYVSKLRFVSQSDGELLLA